MKRLIPLFLCVLLCALCFFGCTDVSDVTSDTTQEESDSQEPSTSIIAYENGVYTITLPVTREVIEVNSQHERYMPTVTEERIRAAEERILEEVTNSQHSDFYLTVESDRLCLTVEIIVDIDPPQTVEGQEHVTSGCGIDHDHVFFKRPISE